MDDPATEIREVVLKLTTGSPRVQEQTLNAYFTPNASFTHPFCSVKGNRHAILRIFQWYKIMSPHIQISINSIAFDSTNLILYVHISQVFKIWLIPFYKAPVTLTTVLQLERGQNLNKPANHDRMAREKYYITSQNDLYQVDQFIRFVLPWGIGSTIVLIFHWFATLFCIIGARICYPIRWNQQARADAVPLYPPDVGPPAAGKQAGAGKKGGLNGWASEFTRKTEENKAASNGMASEFAQEKVEKWQERAKWEWEATQKQLASKRR